MSLTDTLAQFVVNTSYADLPPPAVLHAKLCLIDWLGCTLAGSQEKATDIVVNTLQEMGGTPQASVLGRAFSTSAMNACLANGCAAHVLDFDDFHAGMIGHPSAPLWPAILAVGEWKGIRGAELVTAFVAGYEVEARLGLALNPSHYAKWHSTGTLGCFAAAAGAGKLLGLDAGRMKNALGIAGTQASGLRQVFGTMSKSLNVGKAAANGLLAALLASRGFTGSQDIVEGQRGFAHAVASEMDVGRAIAGLGRDFQVMDTAFKRHASCFGTQCAIDAALEIRQAHGVGGDEVASIRCASHPLAVDMAGKPDPQTALEAKFSLAHCLSLAFLEGRADDDLFTDEMSRDPRLVDLRRRTEVLADPSLQDLAYLPAEVTVRTKGGSEYTRRVESPRGTPLNPLPQEELEEKFRRLGARVLNSETLEKVLREVDHFEELVSPRELLRLCRGHSRIDAKGGS